MDEAFADSITIPGPLSSCEHRSDRSEKCHKSVLFGVVAKMLYYLWLNAKFVLTALCVDLHHSFGSVASPGFLFNATFVVIGVPIMFIMDVISWIIMKIFFLLNLFLHLIALTTIICVHLVKEILVSSKLPSHLKKASNTLRNTDYEINYLIGEISGKFMADGLRPRMCCPRVH